MASTLTLTPCSPSSCRSGERALYKSCSTLAHTEDNGPYMISPQYSSPPPSPLTSVPNKPVQIRERLVHSSQEVARLCRSETGYRSIKLGDGRTVAINNLVPVDSPQPYSPSPSCFKRSIMKCLGMSGWWRNIWIAMFYDSLKIKKFDFFLRP